MRTAHIDAVDRREGREFFHHASHEWGERHPERCSKSSQTALGWTRGEKVAQGKLVNLVENVRKEYWSFRVSGGNKGPLRPILEPVVGLEPTTDGLQNRCSTTELNWHLTVHPLCQAESPRPGKPLGTR